MLITGASRGIGEATARAFADEGATVALVARSKDAIERLAEDLGGSAHYADLSESSQVAGLIERLEADGGPTTYWSTTQAGKARKVFGARPTMNFSWSRKGIM